MIKQMSLAYIVDRINLACALNHMPWTSELKNGCIPVITCTHSSDTNDLVHWKKEEFVKFAQVAQYVLHSITPKPNYSCFLFLLHRICQLLFSMNLRIVGKKKKSNYWKSFFGYMLLILKNVIYSTEHCTENLKYITHSQ